MKAKLEFNLPDDQTDFDLALKGPTFALVLFEFDQWLRGEIKHGQHTVEGYTTLELVREILWDKAVEHNLDLREL